MTDPTGDALKASAAQVPALTKTQIETLSNNIHNVNDYAYTIECLTYHLGAAALSPVEQAPQPVAWRFKHKEHENPWRYSEEKQELSAHKWVQEPLYAAPTEAPPVESQAAEIRAKALEEAAKVAEAFATQRKAMLEVEHEVNAKFQGDATVDEFVPIIARSIASSLRALAAEGSAE